MDINGIKILEGNNLSPSKRQQKQNMQMLYFLTTALCFLCGCCENSILGFPCTQGHMICNPRQVGEKSTVFSGTTAAEPNESGGLHAKSR
jgi:hypothetical protein